MPVFVPNTSTAVANYLYSLKMLQVQPPSAILLMLNFLSSLRVRSFHQISSCLLGMNRAVTCSRVISVVTQM